MGEIIVRRAQAVDLEGLVPLFDGYRQFYEQASNLSAARDFLRQRFARDESVIFIAHDGGQAAGFAQLYPTFSSVSIAPIVVLNDLFVAPEARKKGVGRLLLEAAARHAKDTGAIRLTLTTATTNTTAQALYESAGWKRDERFFTYHLSTRSS